MAGHQKEAVVTEGAEGSAWRLTSDEGLHLQGTDLAPFPLGFFNAGMQADLYGRIRALAADARIALDAVAIRVVNHYWLTGSFIHGTGEGHAEAPDIEVQVQSRAIGRHGRDAGRRRDGRLAGDRLPARAAHRQHVRALHQRPAAARSRASPIRRAPMPAIPIASMPARRARSTPMRAAT